MTTVKDRINSNITLGADGIELTREYLLQGLTGSPEAKLYNALTHASIPKQGDFHPVIPFVRVTSISAVPIDSDTIEVSVVYRLLRAGEAPPEDETVIDAGLIQVGSATQSTTTQIDKDGNQLSVSIKKTSISSDGNVTETIDTQTGEVTIEVPSTVLRRTRKERNPPTNKSALFSGAVNRTSIWGYAPRTLLCLRLEGVSSDGGRSYEVSYEFQYNPQTWDATILYIDDDTDKPHKDVNLRTGNGVETVRVYQEQEFRSLNINF